MIDFLTSNFQEVMSYFNLYYSDSKYFVLFLIALVLNFIFIKKDNKKERVLLLWLPIMVVLIIMNPVIFKHLNKLIGEDMGNTYWRVFWLVPLAPVVAYAFTNLIDYKDRKIGKAFIILAFIGIISISGKLVYNSTNFQKVGNWYKMPDNILNVILASKDLELENKKVMCPLSVIPWVRPVTVAPKFAGEYSNGVIKAHMKRIMRDKCNILILDKGFEYDANVEDYGYVLFYENDQYVAYVNESI